ncbi:FkbM family methyltransferase [Okeania sp. SIO2B3]|uniref:FkbM family methyltransferase n=1 Tax=Okeania sp. SIO2B3 TaxID=2607784 RepID=UPI0013BF7090|nr:FkbM family methyltransferase [Okeania sp. SIO2B3]NET41324.1 FkbM family methyltransferase [Okeania sp. SIO2B3]
MKREHYTEVKLPNGMKIFCLLKNEVKLVYSEVQDYIKNGIELHEGNTVFDVGANIGLFTLLTYQLCNKNVKVYAFEPIPEIFEVLQANVQRFDAEKLMVFPYGLSQESKSVTFFYYPKVTIGSTMYPPSKEEIDELKQTLMQNLIKNLNIGWTSWIRWIPPFLRQLIIDNQIEKGFQGKQVTCQLRTLSEVIREHNVEQIDLLKVDVEKSELDVLLGIEDRDWQKIKQVVVEVHNLDFKIEKTTSLLKEKGLSKITVEQNPFFNNNSIVSLYALRQKSEEK